MLKIIETGKPKSKVIINEKIIYIRNVDSGKKILAWNNSIL